MVTITFPDRKTDKQALVFFLHFLGRYFDLVSTRCWRPPWKPLQTRNILLTVKGKATYEQHVRLSCSARRGKLIQSSYLNWPRLHRLQSVGNGYFGSPD
jgi:hypothetical protein